MTYVNEGKFLKWYRSKSLDSISDDAAILESVRAQHLSTQQQIYVITASKSKSGKDEKYKFRFENVGCCGASTMFIYF